MGVKQGLAIAVTLGALSGCTVLDSHNILGRGQGFAAARQGVEARIPTVAEERAAAVEVVYSTIRDRYVRADLNDVDWPAARAKWGTQAINAKTNDEFWELLDKMAGELGDAHTRVHSPTRARELADGRITSLGLNVREVDGALMVLAVNGQSDAYWAGVRTGMRITQIDGKDALEMWQTWLLESRKSSTEVARARAPLNKLTELAAQYAAHGAANPLRLEFERAAVNAAAAERFTAQLKPTKIAFAGIVNQRTLPSGFGYVQLTAFDGRVQNKLLDAIRSLKDTPGMVLDLRGNGGGRSDMMLALVSAFLKAETKLGTIELRGNKSIRVLGFTVVKAENIKAPQNTDAYGKPLVVLIDAGSASASEGVANALQETGRAKIVGAEPSCGCLLGFLGYAHVPGGGQMAYSEIALVSVKGERVEGKGVQPDVLVPRSREDVLLQRDRVLERAELVLAEELLQSVPAAPAESAAK